MDPQVDAAGAEPESDGGDPCPGPWRLPLSDHGSERGAREPTPSSSRGRSAGRAVPAASAAPASAGGERNRSRTVRAASRRTGPGGRKRGPRAPGRSDGFGRCSSTSRRCLACRGGGLESRADRTENPKAPARGGGGPATAAGGGVRVGAAPRGAEGGIRVERLGSACSRGAPGAPSRSYGAHRFRLMSRPGAERRREGPVETPRNRGGPSRTRPRLPSRASRSSPPSALGPSPRHARDRGGGLGRDGGDRPSRSASPGPRVGPPERDGRCRRASRRE